MAEQKSNAFEMFAPKLSEIIFIGKIVATLSRDAIFFNPAVSISFEGERATFTYLEQNANDVEDYNAEIKSGGYQIKIANTGRMNINGFRYKPYEIREKKVMIPCILKPIEKDGKTLFEFDEEVTKFKSDRFLFSGYNVCIKRIFVSGEASVECPEEPPLLNHELKIEAFGSAQIKIAKGRVEELSTVACSTSLIEANMHCERFNANATQASKILGVKCKTKANPQYSFDSSVKFEFESK